MRLPRQEVRGGEYVPALAAFLAHVFMALKCKTEIGQFQNQEFPPEGDLKLL